MFSNTQENLAFLELLPDWTSPVRLIQSWSTSIIVTRDGTEQRNARRSFPLWSIAYLSSSQSTVEWARRRVALAAELESAVVVPLWPVPETLASMTGQDVANFSASIERRAFKPGGYAYFVQNGNRSSFRKIFSVSGTAITFYDGVAYPGISLPTFTAGALVYPCIVGSRDRNTVDSSAPALDTNDEVVFVEELGVPLMEVGS